MGRIVDHQDTDKTRERLILELVDIQARLAAKEQVCREQAQEIVRLKSLQRRHTDFVHTSGANGSDIAEPNRMGRAVAHQKELLQSIVDNIPVFLVMYDPRLKRFLLNRHAEAVLGWTTADANAGDFMSKAYPDPAYRAEVVAYMQSLEPGWREWSVTTKGGGSVPSSWANIRLSDETMVGIGVDLRARNQALQALQESERNFRLVLENTHFIPSRFDKDLRYQWIYNLPGDFDPLQVIGKRDDELDDSPGSRLLMAFKQQVIDSGTGMRREISFELSNGTRSYDVMLEPVRDETGSVVGGITAAFDITERKLAELRLMESEERFRIMADGLPLIVWVHDAEGRQQFVNRTFLEYFGITEEEMEDSRWQSLMHPDDRNAYTRAFEVCIRERRLFHAEVRVQAADGVWRWIESFAKPRISALGKFHGFVGTSVDITERKRSEKALLTTTERLELLAVVAERLLRSENPRVIIEDLCRLVLTHLDCQFFFNYLVEEPGPLLHLNAYAGIPADAAGAIRQFDFGESISGCVARDGQRIIAEDIQNSSDPLTRVLKTYGMRAYCCHPLIVQETIIGTLAFGTRTRSAFAADETALMKSVSDQVAVALQRLRVEKSLQQLNQSLEHQVAVRTAIADQRPKQLQSLAIELIEAEEKERQRVSQLLHDDLQQILASARFQLQAFSANLPAEPMLERVEQLLAESIAKSRRLSHDLCPAVLYHSGLVSALEWVVRQMSEQFGLNVRMDVDTVQPLADAPVKVFVFRAVQELLFNIVKHAQVKDATLAISNFDAHHLVVVVSDRGCGFHAEKTDLPTTAEGFGLLTIRERAHYIGGRLLVESLPGSGSRIELRVPLKIAKVVDPRHSASAIEEKARMISESEGIATGQGIRVLFADDHKVIRAGMIRLMSGQPDIVVVGEAANGREALDLALQLKPDLVIMDIGMPEMDGIEATRRIKAQLPNTCILGLSMLDHEQVIMDMRRAGADAFVSKSATSAELLKAIYDTRRDFSASDRQR
jgi:PAS domain S-box-containing protein